MTSLEPTLKKLRQRFPEYLKQPYIIITASQQSLLLVDDGSIISRYQISTAEAGLGNKKDSYQTPLGVHIISETFGENAELGTIFKARIQTSSQASILTEPHQKSDADTITSRILWLSGLEAGVNLGGDVDTHERFIYIHGTDEEGRLGKAASHGCIRMANLDVIELFSKVKVGTLVNIIA